MLSEEQKQKYLDDPTKCPNCNGGWFIPDGRAYGVDAKFMFQDVMCADCKEFYTIAYTVTDIDLTVTKEGGSDAMPKTSV